MVATPKGRTRHFGRVKGAQVELVAQEGGVVEGAAIGVSPWRVGRPRLPVTAKLSDCHGTESAPDLVVL